MMETGKISRRIEYFMEKREISTADLASETGLEKKFIETMLAEDIYPPPSGR